MSDAASTAAVYQARIEAPLALGPRIALALEEAHHPSPVAISLFELPQGRCEITAHYATAPAREDLLAVIDGAAGEALGALSIDAIPANDWVTLSQAKRGPVRAGRFYVHGSHDRAHAPTRRFVVEIDANQAFGTAHHATTRGCLIALDDALKRRPPKCILDLGTGTGVLAIAAANALKARVLASDNDPLAASIAAGNAGANCAARLRARLYGGGSRPPYPQARAARPDPGQPADARFAGSCAGACAAHRTRRHRGPVRPYRGPGATHRGTLSGAGLHLEKTNRSRRMGDFGNDPWKLQREAPHAGSRWDRRDCD